jgi:hypothetical protein
VDQPVLGFADVHVHVSCPNDGQGPDYFYDAGAIMTSVIPPGGGKNPFVDLIPHDAGVRLRSWVESRCPETGPAAAGRTAVGST